jgi:hypothetical protein
MDIIEKKLEVGEYYQQNTPKKILVLHHTSGSHRADWTIDGWNKDRTSKKERLRVATPYIIGGLNKSGLNTDNMDGKIYQTFDDIYWAHHLGTKNANNTFLNSSSIGIEICNYGPITKTKDGRYLTYVNSIIDESQVCDLGFEFRGSRYYHKYTDNQIQALKELLIDLSNKHNINLKSGLFEVINKPNGGGFEYNSSAISGKSGIWSHTSYRKDKSDVSPQPNLISMLKSL